MERSFKYTILQASPDPRRGERVNVGIVVFMPTHMDVRFAELRKLQALTGQKWERYAGDYKGRVSALFEEGTSESVLLKRVAGLEKIITPSEFGWLTFNDNEEYERRVGEILRTFVSKPGTPRLPIERRLNTEIAQEFKRAKILADKEDVAASHRVMRDVDVGDELRADFVVKNGVYHVTATLDLRKASVEIAEAALKSIVLDRAKIALSPDARTIGVYALETVEAHGAHPHIHLLSNYADEMYNWSNHDEKTAYQHRIYDAVNYVKGTN